MGKKKTKFKAYGKYIHYWPDEIKPLLLASSCVELAKEHSQEANDIYEQIVDAWDRPDCQELLKGNIEIPKDEVIAWINAATKRTDYIQISVAGKSL